jgi:hypothetical protein
MLVRSIPQIILINVPPWAGSYRRPHYTGRQPVWTWSSVAYAVADDVQQLGPQPHFAVELSVDGAYDSDHTGFGDSIFDYLGIAYEIGPDREIFHFLITAQDVLLRHREVLLSEGIRSRQLFHRIDKKTVTVLAHAFYAVARARSHEKITSAHKLAHREEGISYRREEVSAARKEESPASVEVGQMIVDDPGIAVVRDAFAVQQHPGPFQQSFIAGRAMTHVGPQMIVAQKQPPAQIAVVQKQHPGQIGVAHKNPAGQIGTAQEVAPESVVSRKSKLIRKIK